MINALTKKGEKKIIRNKKSDLTGLNLLLTVYNHQGNV